MMIKFGKVLQTVRHVAVSTHHLYVDVISRLIQTDI